MGERMRGWCKAYRAECYGERISNKKDVWYVLPLTLSLLILVHKFCENRNIFNINIYIYPISSYKLSLVLTKDTSSVLVGEQKHNCHLCDAGHAPMKVVSHY